MSDRPVIAYDRTPDGRSPVESDDTPILDVSPRWPVGLLIAVLLFFFLLATAVWSEWSSRRSLSDQIVNLLPVAFPVLMSLVVASRHEVLSVRRAILRPYAGGFVLERTGWRKHPALDVAWHEVGDVAVVSGQKPAFQKRPCWLRIDLLNTSPAEVIHLDLMHGRPADEVFRAAGVLERLWQNAATDRRPPE